MDIKDHDRDHNLTYVVSPDKLHVKMKFWVSVMMWFSSDYVFLYLINKTFALKVCLHFNLVFRCTSAEESRASSRHWLTHFITITFTIMAQRFSWVQQCTATLGVTWRSHLRSIFTHRNLLGSLTFFFPFEHNLFSTQAYFLAFFFKEKNNIHHSKKSPTAFTNLSRDKTRNKVGLWEPVKLKHGEKFQEPSASPHPLFGWHESHRHSTHSHSLEPINLYFSCLKAPEHSVFLPKVLSTKLWARVCWIRTQAVSCYLFACYLLLGFLHSHCSAFFLCACQSGTRKAVVTKTVTHFCSAAEVRKPPA